MTVKDSYLEGNTKFCATCGAQIHEKAEICPYCGVRCSDVQYNVEFHKKNNYGSIFAIFGIISGLGVALIIYYLNVFANSLSTNLNGVSHQIPIFTLALIIFSSLCGVLGIWLSSKDTELAVLEYLIAIVGMIIGTLSILGIVPITFFILAAFLEYKNHSVKNNGEVV